MSAREVQRERKRERERTGRNNAEKTCHALSARSARAILAYALLCCSLMKCRGEAKKTANQLHRCEYARARLISRERCRARSGRTVKSLQLRQQQKQRPRSIYMSSGGPPPPPSVLWRSLLCERAAAACIDEASRAKKKDLAAACTHEQARADKCGKEAREEGSEDFHYEKLFPKMATKRASWLGWPERSQPADDDEAVRQSK